MSHKGEQTAKRNERDHPHIVETHLPGRRVGALRREAQYAVT